MLTYRIDGCAVLEKDVEVLEEAWRKATLQKAEKEEKVFAFIPSFRQNLKKIKFFL